MVMIWFIAFIDVDIVQILSTTTALFLPSPETWIWISIKIRTCIYTE